MTSKLLAALFPLVLCAASCGPTTAGESPKAAPAETGDPFRVTPIATFNEPWALAPIPGSPLLLITEKSGTLKLLELGGAVQDITLPVAVAYGGQGGLGDVVLAPDFASSGLIYLSYAEPGPGDTRGAAVARARLVQDGPARLDDFTVIWRQDPKVTGRGHYSHRIAFSPDGRELYVASGERQKMDPAQDLSGNLGKVVRLALDGTPMPGNPFAARGGTATQIWSYGHRNILGLAFDPQGRLWDLEHGPAGGDELNLVRPGQNYGWPLVSEGNHYDGRIIARHATRPDLAAPAVSWSPVIAPGDMLFYRGAMFPGWRGQVLIAGLGSQGLVRVRIDGERASEQARYPLGKRIRDIAEADDGSLLVIEDGPGGRLLQLSRK